jgi:hypothetical protein
MFGVLNISNANSAFTDDDLVSIFAAPLNVYSKRIVSVSDTLSLRRRTSSSLAQRWEIETNMSFVADAAGFWINNIMNDVDQDIFIKMPQPVMTHAQASGIGVDLTKSNKLAFPDGTGTAAGATAGANTVSITAGGSARCFVGNFIKFSGHSKIYLVTSISGSSFGIFPALIANVSGDTVYFNPAMTGRYDIDQLAGMKYVDGILADPGTVRIIESL